MNKEYVQFIKELKGRIISSRYIAARLANREQLILYYQTGKRLSEKIAAHHWGAKIIDQIANDLQKELPGLRGFSRRNLLNMRQFYEAYPNIEFLQSPTAKIQTLPENRLLIDMGAFFGISFTHHMVLIAKCKDLQERFFYMQAAAAEFWSVAILQHHIEAGLYHNRGQLPNNFGQAIPEKLKTSALNMFRDEYLLDYIQANEDDTEKEVENKVVRSIRDFILRAGKGFCFIRKII